MNTILLGTTFQAILSELAEIYDVKRPSLQNMKFDRKQKMSDAAGTYYPCAENSRGHIVLRHFRGMQKADISYTLFHEFAHHIHSGRHGEKFEKVVISIIETYLSEGKLQKGASIARAALRVAQKRCGRYAAWKIVRAQQKAEWDAAMKQLKPGQDSILL